MQLPSPSVCPRRSATAARRLAIVSRSRARRGPPCPRAVRERGPGAEVGAALPRGCERDLPPGFALSPFGSSEVLAPRAPVRRGLFAIRALRAEVEAGIAAAPRDCRPRTPPRTAASPSEASRPWPRPRRAAPTRGLRAEDRLGEARRLPPHRAHRPIVCRWAARGGARAGGGCLRWRPPESPARRTRAARPPPRRPCPRRCRAASPAAAPRLGRRRRARAGTDPRRRRHVAVAARAAQPHLRTALS